MADASQPHAKLHVITYLDWQREGSQTFDRQRAHLLDILSYLMQNMPASSQPTQAVPRQFLFSTQTVVLSDIAELRAKLLASLVIYNAGERLDIGPWYVEVDGLLTGGEALVRNLLLARVDTQEHGIKLAQIVFALHSQQNAAQLPQILQNFGIKSVIFGLHNPKMLLPFIWQALDGSRVLVTIASVNNTAEEAIATQREWQPDGPFLWLNHFSNPQTAPILHDQVELPVEQSRLEQYIQDIQASLPSKFRPTVSGELHLTNERTFWGRLSARRDLKQRLAQLEADLLHYAEPLQAVALTHGKLPFPKNQRVLLDFSWRLLLQNQAWYATAGAISDAVHEEIHIRFRRISDTNQVVITNAIDALDGLRQTVLPSTVPATSESYQTSLVVWNLQDMAVKQVVELTLAVLEDFYPAVLVAPSGQEQTFHWDATRKKIGFLADAPPVGYVVYRLTLSRDKTAAYNQARQVDGSVIGSASSASLGISEDALEWRFGDHHIPNLLTYHDGGDDGDVWHYQEPRSDLVVQANLVDTPQVEATPTYERLNFRNRMRIAPRLTDGVRYRGLRVLDISSQATYYNNVPGVYFSAQFTNNAEDHRLRAYLRTGLQADTLYTLSAFSVNKRSITADALGVQPLRHVLALHENETQRGLALFTRGLLEFELLLEAGQVTIALTLLRSVGWIHKMNQEASLSAQLQGDQTVEFMLLPLTEHDPAQLLRLSQRYQAPLRAYQYSEAPSELRHSFLSIDSERLVMTTLKPHRSNRAWVVRLLNPTAGDVGANLIADRPFQKVSQMDMSETILKELTPSDRTVNVALEPYQVMTLYLEFAQI